LLNLNQIILLKKILFILLLLTSSVFAQSKYKLLHTIESEVDFFTSDNQSNIYIIKGNELNKFDKAGKLLYKYSNKNLGNISYVDASNMLKILVYYKDFSQALFLDNTLSLSGEPISFDKIGFQQVQLACTSNNNGIWLFNQQNTALVQLNTAYETVHISADLNSILNMDLQPISMVEYDNKIYVNNPSTGILIFDIYGTYYKTIPVKNVEKFQPMRDLVYFLKANKVNAYNIKTTEEMEFNVPVSEMISFRLEVETLMIQTKTGISIYTPAE